MSKLNINTRKFDNITDHLKLSFHKSLKHLSYEMGISENTTRITTKLLKI